jgi:hypothetical protein
MHRPMRPSWDCAGCGLAWPCPTSQRQLVAEFRHAYVSLTLYLARYFVKACEDLGSSSVGVLHDRFLRWARSPAVRAAVAGHGAAPAEDGSTGAAR